MGEQDPRTSRPYRMGRRAEQVEETRQRIVAAAVDLHTTIGPAHTTVSELAERAGVSRLTVYRHFPEEEALFQACLGHWSARHPWPDPAAWWDNEDPGTRAREALAELYGWYGEHGDELLPIYRDLPAAPRSAQEAVDEFDRRMAEALVVDREVPEQRRPRLRAAAVHVVRLWTWHSLAVEQGLGDQQAAELAAGMLEAAAHG